MTSDIRRRRALFLTRQACPLCDEAAALVDRFAPRFGITIETVDVDGDEALAAEYGERVPVLLGIGHRVLAEGHMTRFTVQRALMRLRLRR